MKTKKIILGAAIIYLVALVFFLWGLAAGKYKIFPWSQVERVCEELHSYSTFTEGEVKSARDITVLDHQEHRTSFAFSGFRILDYGFQDNGYLLISRYSKKHSQVIVELFSLAGQKAVHTWIPPLADIFSASPAFDKGSNTQAAYYANHPLMLEDGSIIFSSGEGPLVRIDACSDLQWTVNETFHHSIERDRQGNIVAAVRLTGKSPAALPVKNDGFAVITPGGELLKEYSVADILLNNNQRALLYGVGRFEWDRIHLNDAQPILRNSEDAKAGDIALSIRNLSTVLLFHPESQKITWLKTGPWLNQHDVNQLENGSYSIFGNDIVRDAGNKPVLLNKTHSNIYLYDPVEDSVSRPFAEIMQAEEVATKKEGRTRILANGDAFIEETGKSRLLRISQDKVRWEYVNSVSPDTVGAIHWSRYISEKEMNLKWMEDATCNQSY